MVGAEAVQVVSPPTNGPKGYEAYELARDQKKSGTRA